MNASTLQQFEGKIRAVRGEIRKVIVGHDEMVRQLLIALLAGGHALLEGVPGLGKTKLIRTVAHCFHLEFSRIQFTPDLMPADILGTNILSEGPQGREWRFQRGPIFGNIVLADEINRATPKTQSALLEAMAEGAVTIGGTRYAMTQPFFVLATQNPIDMEGTYPLPEAQLDRFLFKIQLASSGVDELVEILKRTTGESESSPSVVMEAGELLAVQKLIQGMPAPDAVLNYAARLVDAGHPGGAAASPLVRKYVRFGASPRAAQALVLGGKAAAFLAGQTQLNFAAVRSVALPALSHRLILNFEAEAEGIKQDRIVSELLEHVTELAGDLEKLSPRKK